MSMSKGIVRYSLESVLFYMSSARKRKAIWMFLLLLLTSFLDVLGLASLVPVMMVAAEPGGVQKNRFFSALFHSLNFQSERNFLLFLIVSVFAFFLIKNVFATWVNYLQTRFTADLGLDIVKSQLDKYLHFPFWSFNHLGSANLINSALEVPRAYIFMVIQQLFNLFAEATVMIVIVISILLYKPLLLVLLAAVLLPAALLTYRYLRSRSQAVGVDINRIRPISFGIVGDLFIGFVELKLADKQYRFRDRLLANEHQLQLLAAKSYLYSLLPLKVIEMVAILGVLTIFLYSILVPGSSTNLIALVGLFAAAAYRMMPSVNRMLNSLMALKQSQANIENLALYREPEYNETPHAVQLPLTFDHTLAFDHLSFNFPGEQGLPTLNDINLTIQKGEKIGFIGSSGSGKTTLMNVLLRFYSEQTGHVLIDGKPLTSQHLADWHRIVGYVKQDTFLMEASIQDNITLGDATVDTARLDYAIEQASLRPFVSGLPEGVHTHIGERGSKLSGGQRQRIGIARALYKRTQLLVLDEATSALDNETEREVNEAINKLSGTDITILIIAHRITTLRECDRIYELNKGKVIAVHQYDELLARIV